MEFEFDKKKYYIYFIMIAVVAVFGLRSILFLAQNLGRFSDRTIIWLKACDSVFLCLVMGMLS